MYSRHYSALPFEIPIFTFLGPRALNLPLMSRILLTLFQVICLFGTAHATVFLVGPDQLYPNPNALYTANVVDNGDTINVQAGNYTGRAALAVWQADSLLIRGVGEQPQLYADGEFILGKGVWVFSGNDITVENIGFHDATVPDQNGAGIRLDGVGITVRNCLFRNNENGILTSNPGIGDIIIEYSEFDGNGFGDGFSHNLYVGTVGSLTFRFNYSHHARVGHCLKSRAKENNIRYNHFSDEETGNSSRLIDLPNGGRTFIVGNVLHQGPEALNRNVIGYGHEGFFNAAFNEIYVGNNTFISHRAGTWSYVDARPGTEKIWVVNNIFAGTEATAIVGVVMFEVGNIRLLEDMVEFVDAANYDYRLTQDSPAIDASRTDFDGGDVFEQPGYQYFHPLDATARPVIGNTDVGAYEYKGTVATMRPATVLPRLSPNPASGILRLNLALNASWRIFDISGKAVLRMENANELDLSGLPAGVYLVQLHTLDGLLLTERIVKY